MEYSGELSCIYIALVVLTDNTIKSNQVTSSPQFFQHRCIVATLPMNWRMVDKQLGCWVICHGVVGFVFKFCSNWTNFDFSAPFLMRRGGVVSVRKRCPRWCRVRHPCRLRYCHDLAGSVCSRINKFIIHTGIAFDGTTPAARRPDRSTSSPRREGKGARGDRFELKKRLRDR